MGGNPLFPFSPVSGHRCGCSREQAQARHHFLSTCSFLQVTMTSISASQVILAEHTENSIPLAEVGEIQHSLVAYCCSSMEPQPGCSQTSRELSSIESRSVREHDQCYHRGSEKKDTVDASLDVLRKTALIQGNASRCALPWAPLLKFLPCKANILEQSTAGCLRVSAVFWGMAWGQAGLCPYINKKHSARHSFSSNT